MPPRDTSPSSLFQSYLSSLKRKQREVKKKHRRRNSNNNNDVTTEDDDDYEGNGPPPDPSTRAWRHPSEIAAANAAAARGMVPLPRQRRWSPVSFGAGELVLMPQFGQLHAGPGPCGTAEQRRHLMVFRGETKPTI